MWNDQRCLLKGLMCDHNTDIEHMFQQQIYRKTAGNRQKKLLKMHSSEREELKNMVPHRQLMLLSGNYWSVSEKLGFETCFFFCCVLMLKKKKGEEKCSWHLSVCAHVCHCFCRWVTSPVFFANIIAAKFALVIKPTAYKRPRHLEGDEQTSRNVMKM